MEMVVTSDKFAEALNYATELHRRQIRKGSSIPYITHLMGVAWLVAEYGGDEQQIIAALLHDGPEDQGGQPILDEIQRRFGERVTSIVAGCTDTLEDPKPPWRPRKEAYISRLATESAETRLVSAADKLCNAQSIRRDMGRMGDLVFAKFQGGKSGALWYFQSVTEEFERGGPHDVATEIRRIFTDIERGLL